MRTPTRVRSARRTTPRVAALTAPLAVAALALTLTACGGTVDEEAGDASPAPAPSSSAATPSDDTSTATSDDTSTNPSAPAAEQGLEVDVEIADGSVTPSGKRVEAAVGEPITLNVTSDAEAEIHVHSTPDEEFEIEPGTSQHTFTIDTPGVVEVELHDPALQILSVAVS